MIYSERTTIFKKNIQIQDDEDLEDHAHRLFKRWSTLTHCANPGNTVFRYRQVVNELQRRGLTVPE